MTGTEETSTEQRITKRKIDDLLAKWSNAIQRPLRRKTTPASDREGSISEDYHPDDLSNKRPRLDSTFSTSSFESNPIPNPEIEYDLSTLTPSEDHYDPTSLSLFLSRLKSFKPSTYQIFNPLLSPPECAKHGWINSSFNKLVCTVCGELLKIDLSSLPRGVGMDVKGESVAIRRYRELLKERHDESCPWRRENRSDSLYTYPLLTAPPTRVFSSLSRNYGSLLHLSNDLPELTTLDLDSTTMDSLIELIHRRLRIPPVESNQARTALTLALLNWSRTSSVFNPPASETQLQQQQTLQCSLCFRTIGLWNFASLSSPSNPPPPSPTPSLPLPSSTASLPSTAPLKPPLNPQSQHHNYCPLIQYTQFHRDFEFIKPEELTTKRIDSCISKKLNWKVVLERVIDGMGLKSEDEIGKEREKQREQKRRVQQSQDGVGGEPTDPQLNYNPYQLLRQVKNVLSNPHKIEISSTIKSLARKHQIQTQSDIQPQNQTLQSPSTIVTDTVDRNVNVEIVEIVETGEGTNDDGKL